MLIKKKTSLFNHEIAYLIPNSPFAQYQYFFSSISYPFITSFRLCQYQLFPSLTFLLICTIPIPSSSFLSQNIFPFNFFTHLLLFYSISFLFLSLYSFLFVIDLGECKDGPYNACLSLFTFSFTTFLFWVIGFPI